MEKPYVFITRKLPEAVIKPIQEKFTVKMWPHEDVAIDREVLLNEVENADGLISMLSDQIDKEVLMRAKHLKVVANLAVGFDNIDLQTAKEKNIVVCNTPDVLTETTADLTFALLMATARRLTEASEYVKEGNWKNWSPLLFAGNDIYGKTVGIVGMGRIGEAFARRTKGFNMNILYHNRSRKIEAENELNAKYVSFEELITTSDFIVCLAPLNEDTRAMFDENAFKKMKSSAIFINASRGANVVEDDLYEALKVGEIQAAGLDVFCNEPIDETHPLLTLKNVVALPHIGSSSLETRMTMMQLCIDNIELALSGLTPKTPVQ